MWYSSQSIYIIFKAKNDIWRKWVQYNKNIWNVLKFICQRNIEAFYCISLIPPPPPPPPGPPILGFIFLLKGFRFHNGSAQQLCQCPFCLLQAKQFCQLAEFFARDFQHCNKDNHWRKMRCNPFQMVTKNLDWLYCTVKHNIFWQYMCSIGTKTGSLFAASALPQNPCRVASPLGSSHYSPFQIRPQVSWSDNKLV